MLGLSFRAFNLAFDWTAAVYTWVVGRLLRVSLLVLVVYGGLLYLTYASFEATPKGFIPSQDKGYLLVNLQLARLGLGGAHRAGDAADRGDRAGDAGRQAHGGHRRPVDPAGRQRAELRRDVRHARRISQAAQARDLSGDAIAARLQAKLQDEIADGVVNVLGAPPVEGLGTAGGFKIMIEDRGNSGLDALQAVADAVVADAARQPELDDLFTSFRANTPWLYLDIDRTAAKMMGVSMAEVFNTLQVYLGSLYVNDFNLFGRTWQVNVQADQNFREQIEDLKQLKVRNDRGRWCRSARLATVRDVTGPVLITRYNMYPAAPINCSAGPGDQLGPGDRADGERRRTTNLQLVDAVRMDRAGAVAIANRQHGHARVRAGRGAGVSGAGRPVRKLVAAAGRDPGRADVPAVLDCRRCWRRTWTSTFSRRSASSC